MLFRKVLLFFLFLVLPMLSVSAQAEPLSTASSRAARLYALAIRQYENRQLSDALELLHRAIRRDPDFVEAYLLAGDISRDMKNNEQAIEFYRKAMEINPSTFPQALYILGTLYLAEGKYNKALEVFETYRNNYTFSADDEQRVKQQIERSQVALTLFNNPVLYDPVNLGQNVNTEHDEYVNVILPDNSMLVFTLKSPVAGATDGRNFNETIYHSLKNNGSWLPATELITGFVKAQAEGAMTISADGLTMFFTACHRPDGYGSCDIYVSQRRGKKWTEPRNLGPVVNSVRWDSQPSFSSDGRTLFFVSTRAGGYGGSDIWITQLQANGFWSPVVNAGPVINTPADELTPYIHPDGKSLYFSSYGHPGLGGADLFISRWISETGWSEPQNLGYPINTLADEIGLVVDAKGQTGYISSNIPGGQGGYDIYSFTMYNEIRPMPVTFIRGNVVDHTNSKPLEADLVLTDLVSGREVVRSQSDSETGEFLTVLPTGHNYAMSVNKLGYLFYSRHFALDTVRSWIDPLLLEIRLKPISPGEGITLHNVFFDHDSYEILNVSLPELHRLKQLLIENPSIRVLIEGHTDNTGTPAYNLTLSDKRAQSVRNFLVNKGILPERIEYAGKGDTIPVASNDTPEGRALNRRTEFIILHM